MRLQWVTRMRGTSDLIPIGFGTADRDLCPTLDKLSHPMRSTRTRASFDNPLFIQGVSLECEDPRSREAFPRLVPGSDFKSDGGCGDALPAGSIPVRFRPRAGKSG